jgi:hypothetical protein
MGAAIFSAIEYSKEKNTIDDLKAKRQEFLQKYKACINGKYRKIISLYSSEYFKKEKEKYYQLSFPKICFNKQTHVTKAMKFFSAVYCI